MIISNINKLVEREGGQQLFADKIGVDRSTVSRWCAGKTIPDLKQAIAISQNLNISLDSLLLGKEPGGDFMCGWDEESIEACKVLKEILESGDKMARAAILSNLDAFKDSIDKNKRIKRLEEDVEQLKKGQYAASKAAKSG
jgi:transcriptional regulator with XRE-family HTH domain